LSEDNILSGFQEKRIYSISDLNARIALVLEGEFDEVMVEGEISNFTRAASGHMYFTLKDSKSQISCVMFRGNSRFLRFQPESGMKVTARANVSVYSPRGVYQLNISSLEPAGIGALQLAFEQLKRKLEAEGLFAPERKKPLPFLPHKIGVVTSPTGAAIRDILSVLKRRYPNVQVLIYPTLVQGEDAPAGIVRGIEKLDELGSMDVIMVSRGGGSIEDLWAFNDEKVARAIAACKTPVVSAVGHEIDFTIADFVADLRAPTPSAAAEIVVGRKDDLVHTVNTLEQRVASAMKGRVRQARAILEAASPQRMLARLRGRLDFNLQKLDELDLRLKKGAAQKIERGRNRLAELSASLEALSPLRALKRGYSIVSKENEQIPLTKVGDITAGDRLDVRLSDGKVQCQVDKIHKREN
jgi:exodeoxyribonuclease VII large subunit